MLAEQLEQPKLSDFAQEQIESLALAAVAEIVHSATVSICKIIADAQEKIGETITTTDLSTAYRTLSTNLPNTEPE